MDRSSPDGLPGLPLPANWVYLCKGLDTVQEAWDYRLHDLAADELEQCRQKAQELSEDGEGLAPYLVAGEVLQVRAIGAKGGFRWVAGNDDFLLMFKPGGAGWSVTVRYLSAGLWESGVEALADRVKDILDVLGKPASDDYRRLTRADMAFDFYAPGFADSANVGIADGVLMPAKCKAKTVTRPHLDKVTTYSRGGCIETLTLGSKSTLQVELYNKSLEITEASGKEWQYFIWIENGLPSERRTDVWRLEVRFGKEWLQNRGVKRLFNFGRVEAGGVHVEKGFMEMQYALLREAIQSRRLTVPTEDSNRARWPLHPFWTIAQEEAPSPILAPVGRYVTGRPEALIAQLEKQMAGTMQSLWVLQSRLGQGEDIEIGMQLSALNAIDRATADPELRRKLKRADERYRFVEEAR